MLNDEKSALQRGRKCLSFPKSALGRIKPAVKLPNTHRAAWSQKTEQSLSPATPAHPVPTTPSGPEYSTPKPRWFTTSTDLVQLSPQFLGLGKGKAQAVNGCVISQLPWMQSTCNPSVNTVSVSNAPKSNYTGRLTGHPAPLGKDSLKKWVISIYGLGQAWAAGGNS